jgi:pantoate--beta-alanine ligase
VEVFRTIASVKEYLSQNRQQGSTIGFVPTMGALHQGHLALVARAKAECSLALCSVFVNPTQFNNAHDLAVYPRTLEADCALLEQVHCDAVFAPEASEMYPFQHQMQFHFGDLEQVMEGKFRPGHFNGVGLVVSKLFHIIQPNKAYFGQKDLQQCAVVGRLVAELNFPLQFIVCPTHREPDGLAMSSRNKNLSPDQRATAPVLYQQLCLAQKSLQNGQPWSQVQAAVKQALDMLSGLELEYFELVKRSNLASIDTLQPDNSALCIAAFLGKTRLIDNLLL